MEGPERGKIESKIARNPAKRMKWKASYIRATNCLISYGQK
jgi:hypothetical protein